MHLFSVNLDNELSSFEIWLNPNGNLLFIRRYDQSIIITFNLLQIQSNIWYFIFLNYDEEQMFAMNKLNCRISYSLNATKIVDKEFEIFCAPDKILLKPPPLNANSSNAIYFYIGHEEKKSKLSNLFSYDLGQVILSRDSNFTCEHIIILMQIMDTNISQLDKLSDYEWGYLNGYANVKLIENVEKNFGEYCSQIKASVVAVYHPKNAHVCALKYANNRALVYTEIVSNCKSLQQNTFDIILNRTGGVRHILMLIAKVIQFNEFIKQRNV